MSINLMSAIFRTEFRDLQDAEGNTTKASTAKFVCIALADHANDEGEGAYPSIGKLSYKTSLSRTAIINALDALKHNGILTSHGKSKWDTVNYTVNPACFSMDSEKTVLVNSVDQYAQLTPPSTPTLPPPVNPVDPNHPLTIQETTQANKKMDGLLAMANFPGAKTEARINSILSYLGERFHVNTETKKWRDFAKYADGRKQKHGEDIEVFIEWLYDQPGFNLTYWPPSKMQEFWPSAFVKTESNRKEGEGFYV